MYTMIWQSITQDVTGKPANYHHGICPKYVNWKNKPENNSNNWSSACKGSWIRWVCNFGTRDLDRVQSSACLFANKFNLDVDKKAALKHFLYVVYLTLHESHNAKSSPYVNKYNTRCNDYCI